MSRQVEAVEMATALTVAAAALDYISRDPARWEAFMGWACAAAGSEPIADRQQAAAGVGQIAALARGVLRAAVAT